MKKSIFLFVFIFSNFLFSKDIHFEIFPNYGYFFGGKVNFYNSSGGKLYGGKVKLGDNYTLGIGISANFKNIADIEVLYNNTPLSAKILYDYGTPPSGALDNGEVIDITVHYIHLNILKGVKFNDDKLIPYGLGALGVTNFYSGDIDKSIWKMSIGLGGGIKYFFSNHIGIRVQGRLLIPFSINGLSIFVSNNGISPGITGNGTLQGDISTGVIFRF